MTTFAVIFIALGAIALGAVAITEYRRWRWIKTNRRPGFVHPQGKKRVG